MKEKLLPMAFGVACGLLGAGIILLTSRPSRGHAIQLLPAPTPGMLVIQVSGAIKNPGIYTLPAGSRARDALSAAGGFTSDANPQAVNQAALLQDGQNIMVPYLAPTLEPGGQRNPAPVIVPGYASTTLININTATLEELDQLPEVGPGLAQRIIDFRQEKGEFTKIEDILLVPGIGEGIFEQIKARITVTP